MKTGRGSLETDPVICVVKGSEGVSEQQFQWAWKGETFPGMFMNVLLPGYGE